MRIYAVADIHGKKHHMAAIYGVLDKYQPDMMVVAGDLSNYFNWKTCLAQLDSLPVPIFAVRGNTDFKRIEPGIEKAGNIDLLTSIPKEIEGFSFVGASGTMILPFASRISLNENQALSALPCPMDKEFVLVVHPPPKGVCDRVAGKISAGSKNLARFIKKARPGLVLCGHIHEQAGKDLLGESIVVNCAMSKSSLGAVIDLRKGDDARVNLLRPDSIGC
ncbi:MAG: metallophosphoesterase [Desulfobacterales bacterium]|nr:metallophosphoesterase [Desulfobacterales bacterium]